MERKGPTMATESRQTEPLHTVLNYPLIDALLHRRSRRFSLGATLNGGGLAYQSEHPPLPLSHREEALLAFAAAGINGFCLGDIPYDEGNVPEGGGGNVIATLTGRTIASADAVHATALCVINDEGTYLLKRPQDVALDEVDRLRQLAADQRYEEVYDRMRVKVRAGRTTIPREVPFVSPFNKWSTNLPGSSYFLPVCDLTGMYINVILSAFDEQISAFMVDERNGFKPAGVGAFARSRGGRLNDDPATNRVVPILRLESIIAEFMLAEQAFMVHNLSLMEQAMGLGGWTHFATATEVAWFEALGFRMGAQRVSQMINAGPLRRLLLKALNQDQAYPYPLGLTLDGADLIKPYCPPYYRSMEEAVLAYVEFKRTHVNQASLDESFPATWKQPSAVQSQIPPFSDACIQATVAYCTYLYETYGRFPSYFGPLRTTLAHQAHHLDLAFYDKFYQPGAYTETQAEHMARWHPDGDAR
jgi:hypothetical protein